MRGDLHNDQELHGLPLSLRARCREVENHRFFIHGREEQLVLESLTTGCGALEAKTTHVDRFKLRWRHGSRGLISWWVILNSSKPHLAPDFIFNDGFLPPIERLPSLSSWDVKRENALVEVLEELIAELISYELRQIPEAHRLEYKNLISMPCVDRRYCSANVLQTISELAEFWIRLRFDNDPLLFADVHCKMGGTTGRSSSLALEMSSCLRRTLGAFEYNGVGTSSNELVRQVFDGIVKGLQEEKNSMNHRRGVLATIITLQGDSLLEVDMEFFRSIHLLLNFSNVYVEIKIELPTRFREKNFQIELSAIDVYSKNCRCERTITVRELMDPMQIANEIMNRTEEMTKIVAQEVLEILGY